MLEFWPTKFLKKRKFSSSFSVFQPLSKKISFQTFDCPCDQIRAFLGIPSRISGVASHLFCSPVGLYVYQRRKMSRIASKIIITTINEEIFLFFVFSR